MEQDVLWRFKGDKNIFTDIVSFDVKEYDSGTFSIEGLKERGIGRLLSKEEVFWRQKARVKWIKEGDYNTKFYKVANGKRNLKFIKSLVSEEGAILDNIESISEETKNFLESYTLSLWVGPRE